MTDGGDERTRRREALALASQEAAVAVVGATAGTAFGPLGAVVAAFVGPYAVLAAKRLRELQSEVAAAGPDEDAVAAKLESDETLAQLVAQATRGVVESDLAAKRRLLARAVVRVLTEADTNVDADARFVRVLSAIDAVDVRVLALLGDPPERPKPDDEAERRREGTTYPDELEARWPGLGVVATSAVATLVAEGLVEDAGKGTYGGLTFWAVTPFGALVLLALEEEGLADELARR